MAVKEQLTHAVDTIRADKDISLGTSTVLKVDCDTLISMLDVLDTPAPLDGDVGRKPVPKTPAL